MTHTPPSPEASARIASVLRQHHEALLALARALNGAPRLTPEHFTEATDPELELIILADAEFGFSARVAAARVYMERRLQRMGPRPEHAWQAGLRRRIPEGTLEELAGAIPEQQAQALEVVREEMTRWMWHLRDGRDPLIGRADPTGGAPRRSTQAGKTPTATTCCGACSTATAHRPCARKSRPSWCAGSVLPKP